jgi:hypothetical protein
VIKLALAARELVYAEAAGAIELIYDAYSAVSSGYTFTGRQSDVCAYVAVYAKGVNIGIAGGAMMSDPDGLLEGAGKGWRHVKIRAMSDLDRPGVRALVRTAVADAERPESGAPKQASIVRAIYPKRRRPSGRA